MRSVIFAFIVAAAGCHHDTTVGSNLGGGSNDAGAVAGASCVSLADTCGPTASSPCCESPTVPGGTFFRSYDVASDGRYPDMGYPATVSSFRLDKYEVTVGRFRQFVEAGMGTQANPPAVGAGAHAAISGSGWDSAWNSALAPDTASLVVGLGCDATYQTWTAAPGANENRPMNCITWYEAMAFCAWDGGYLPSEAEWNYAAAGGTEQRAYPWSSPPGSLELDDTRASYTTSCLGQFDAGVCGETSGLVAVGSKPAGDGRWGQSDLAGNVIEWVLDLYTDPYPLPCDDCSNLVVQFPIRSARGGSFESNNDDASQDIRGAGRNSSEETARDFGVGVRCARPQ